MFQRFRNTVARFMWGRYGNDQLNRFLFILYFIVWVVSLFFRQVVWGLAFTIVLWTLLGWLLFRTLSRNIARRQAENRRYLAIQGRIKWWFGHQLTRLKHVRRYRYRRCRGCKAMLRLPVKRGRRTVTCHRCHAQFKTFFL